MSKKVYIVDYDDYESIQSLIHDALIDLDEIEPSHRREEIRRRLNNVQRILNNEES